MHNYGYFVWGRGGEIGRPACRQAGTHGNQAKLMQHVYALRSQSRKYIYVGLTNNFQRRFKQHNNGYEKTTRPYRPFKLILLENFEDRKTARKREKYLKSGCGKEFLKSIKLPRW